LSVPRVAVANESFVVSWIVVWCNEERLVQKLEMENIKLMKSCEMVVFLYHHKNMIGVSYNFQIW
jgi:hypothetical protein